MIQICHCQFNVLPFIFVPLITLQSYLKYTTTLKGGKIPYMKKWKSCHIMWKKWFSFFPSFFILLDNPWSQIKKTMQRNDVKGISASLSWHLFNEYLMCKEKFNISVKFSHVESNEFNLIEPYFCVAWTRHYLYLDNVGFVFIFRNSKSTSIFGNCPSFLS